MWGRAGTPRWGSSLRTPRSGRPPDSLLVSWTASLWWAGRRSRGRSPRSNNPAAQNARAAPTRVDEGVADTAPSREEVQTPQTGFRRAIGLLPATAVNMTQMCGIGPFITIPIMVATMGGPQAIVGWIAGALLAMADGLVWAELGSAMPSAGGSYVYMREAFQYRSGRLMPFLFIWTAMLTIPLIMATGIIGL